MPGVKGQGPPPPPPGKGPPPARGAPAALGHGALADLEAAAQRLKPTPAPVERRGVSEEFTAEEEDATRRRFFAAGAPHWYALVEEHTFPTEFLPLPRHAAEGIARSDAATLADLAQEIDHVLARRGWSRAFVKLATRSAKDAPQIL